MNHLVQWLFTDPQTAGQNTSSGAVEPFHFWIPWIVFCALGLLIPLYYSLEGRKRFFGGHALHKYMLDKMMGQLALFAGVGLPLMLGRWAMDFTFMSWRIWRYLWLLWGAYYIVYWGYFMIFKYPDMLREYRRHRTWEKYIPQPKPKKSKKPRTAKAATR